jgi:hypothetical protein
VCFFSIALEKPPTDLDTVNQSVFLLNVGIVRNPTIENTMLEIQLDFDQVGQMPVNPNLPDSGFSRADCRIGKYREGLPLYLITPGIELQVPRLPKRLEPD